MGISGLAIWPSFWRGAQEKVHHLADEPCASPESSCCSRCSSALGPFTPGYRFDAVTVGNVASGVALILAFRGVVGGDERFTADAAVRRRCTLGPARLHSQVMLGALVSAQAMTHRVDALIPPHPWAQSWWHLHRGLVDACAQCAAGT